jgi:zinc transporter ZupT
MFQDRQVIGILIAIALLIGIVATALYMTRNLIAEDKFNFLVVVIVSMLLGVWVIDNVIAFKTQLLDDDENKFILQTLGYVMAYVLGTRQNNKDA